MARRGRGRTVSRFAEVLMATYLICVFGLTLAAIKDWRWQR